jgi:hypothetical protein
MVRRQRKSQQIRAASLLNVKGELNVKKEEDEHHGQLKPADVSGRESIPCVHSSFAA